jgi:DNA-binding transcriptional MerR regulator
LTKGPDAFRTISEAADELGLAQHVLRFWETRFAFIRPMKRAGGRRFYRPQDIAVLRGVRTLLHDEGHTIKAVQRLHREQGLRGLIAAGAASQPAIAPVVDSTTQAALPPIPRQLSDLDRRKLRAALEDLTAIKAELDQLLAQRV